MPRGFFRGAVDLEASVWVTLGAAFAVRGFAGGIGYGAGHGVFRRVNVVNN